jgi:hypothetical protein
VLLCDQGKISLFPVPTTEDVLSQDNVDGVEMLVVSEQTDMSEVVQQGMVVSRG